MFLGHHPGTLAPQGSRRDGYNGRNADMGWMVWTSHWPLKFIVTHLLLLPGSQVCRPLVVEQGAVRVTNPPPCFPGIPL